MCKKLTNIIFLEKVIKKHNNLYTYLSPYINNKSKIKIECPLHGIFFQRARNHMRGQGCPKCSGNKKLTNDEFLEKVNKKHNNFYSYPELYINNKSKIKIECPLHGIFEQIANAHLRGQGCYKCSLENKKLTNDEFLEKANKKHNNFYSYPEHYINLETQIKINCPIHGSFETTPYNHITSVISCPKCSLENKKLTNDEFLEKANKKHNNFYSYPEQYINNKTKIKIECPEHGFFEQIARNHLRGNGCQKCANKKLRLNALERIQYNLDNGFQMIPFYNPIACEVFDEISLKENVYIQHAMNVGEFYIKELGYWVDGFDKENNIVYEFDEKHHKYQIEKDLIRENEIKSFLNCEFIRIKE